MADRDPGFRDLQTQADGLLPELISLRRALHADPELGIRLPRTQQRVLDALAGADLEVHTGSGLDSVTAVLHGAMPGPTVLLRGDMDALPMREETDLDYRATGAAMHACGHDLHVAGLVGAAHLLAARRADIAGDVVFMFQPGEETGDGAQRMIDEGVLEMTGSRPVAAYGIHVVPGEYGIFSTRPGPLMAGAAELEVTVHGAGGHASAPHLTRDPVPVLAELVTALQAFVTRKFDVFDPVVVTVTQLHAGEQARNVIGDTAWLGASIRMLSAENLARLSEELPALVENIADAHSCRAEARFAVVSPPTVNDPALAEGALGLLARTFGDDRVRVSPAPVMGSEDFSYVLREVPGTFLFLRATPRHLDLATVAPNHSGKALFEDAILSDQAVALSALALTHVGVPRPGE